MRRVDKLGRIVIPLELRQKYGLSVGAAIEFLDNGEGITVKSSEPFCKICHTRLVGAVELPLCKACIEEVLKRYNGEAALSKKQKS